MSYDWNFDNGSCVRGNIQNRNTARKILLTGRQKSKRNEEKRTENNSTHLQNNILS